MPKPQKRPLDLNELIKGQLALYKGTVNLRLSLAEGLPKVSADKDSLAQLVLNLVENARDALAERAESAIEVSTFATRGGQAVAFAVDDNGPGIPAEVKDKVFTPYFTTKHAKGGSGLGLAICHRIVSDHGGKIVASRSPLGGARFLVELPAEGAGEEVLLASVAGRRRG
jgi:signal transduction histidine kinase